MSKERWAKKKDLKRKEIKRSFFYAIAPRIHVKEWVESVKENVL